MALFRLVWLLLWLCAEAVNAAEPGNLITVVTEPERPLQYEENGEIKGVATEVVKEMFERAGLSVQIQLLPWARAYRQATSNANIGIYSIARIPQRERNFHWIGPIIPYQWSVFRLQSRADIQLSALNDLRHWQVGVVLGDVAHQFLLAKGFQDYPAGNLSTAASAELVLNKLRVGRIDVMLMSEMSCQIPEPFCRQFVRALPLPEMGNGLYLAFRSDSSPRLMRQLNEALQSMALDGTLRRLQQLPDHRP